MQKISINVDVDSGVFSYDIPDGVKTFKFIPHTGEITLKFHKPEVINHYVPSSRNKRVIEPPEDDPMDDYTIEEILEGSEGSIFQAIAYCDDNPIEKAKELSKLRRESKTWKRYRTLSSKLACCIELDDLDACDNKHLGSLIRYYVGEDSQLLEDLLSEAGKKYGTTVRTHRFNYAALEVLKRVRSNGNGSYYTKEELMRPLEERKLLNYSLAKSVVMYSYHTKKMKWLYDLGFYYLCKVLYEPIIDNKLKTYNKIPDVFEEISNNILDYVIETEKKVGCNVRNLPRGLYESFSEVYYQILTREFKKLYPNFNPDLSSLCYDEFSKGIERFPNYTQVIRKKIESTMFMRNETGYLEIRGRLKDRLSEKTDGKLDNTITTTIVEV